MLLLLFGYSILSMCLISVRSLETTTTTSKPTVNPRSSNSEDSCITPYVKTGTCIPLLQCRSLIEQRNSGLVRRSMCGFQGKAPKVCCASIEDEDLQYLISSQAARNSTITITPAPQNDSNSNKTLKTGRQRTESVFASDCGHGRSTFKRIVGGQESEMGAWPWMAVIYYVRRNGKSAECGGVLVTRKHVLTAAHCIVSSRRGITMSPKQLTVRLGDHDIDRDDEGVIPIDLSVTSIIKYNSFDLRTFQNDIAILVLSSSVQFGQHIAPICLPFNVFAGDNLSSRNAFTAGWGTISYGGPASSKLQEVQLKIWENTRCKDVFKKEVPITESNLCAGDGTKDACRGDSGGPLMLAHTDGKFYLIGIVSFGKKCAEPGYPGVYTRISNFIDWVESNIEDSL